MVFSNKTKFTSSSIGVVVQLKLEFYIDNMHNSLMQIFFFHISERKL